MQLTFGIKLYHPKLAHRFGLSGQKMRYIQCFDIDTRQKTDAMKRVNLKASVSMPEEPLCAFITQCFALYTQGMFRLME